MQMIDKKTVNEIEQKLQNVLELHNWQLERGFISTRQEMIHELLLDVQTEIVVALSKNNESSYRSL